MPTDNRHFKVRREWAKHLLLHRQFGERELILKRVNFPRLKSQACMTMRGGVLRHGTGIQLTQIQPGLQSFRRNSAEVGQLEGGSLASCHARGDIHPILYRIKDSQEPSLECSLQHWCHVHDVRHMPGSPTRALTAEASDLRS